MKGLSEKEPKTKKHRAIKYVCTAVIAVAVLAVAYFAGDTVPESKKVSAPPVTSSVTASEGSFSSATKTETESAVTPSESTTTSSVTSETEQKSETTAKSATPAETKATETTVTTDAPTETTISTTTTTTAPAVATTTTTAPPSKVEHTISLLINCENALKADSGLADSIRDELPADGVVFYSNEFEIREGDTVYDVISRACEENGIQMESTKVGMSSAMYIEGIANLYEFDCGNLSGWMYSVNGDFPQISVSQTKVSDGDEVRLLYSCNIGRDVGDNYYS